MDLETCFKEYLSEFEGMEDKVKDLISLEVDDFLSGINGRLDECESPIERMLVVPLMNRIDRSFLHRYGDVFDITVQAPIKINDQKTYRADFLVEFARQEGYIIQKFIIECDGHDYHERSKEQARRDRERDRDLMSAGYMVIRFTGSEIYKDPKGCVHQAITIINRTVTEKLGI